MLPPPRFSALVKYLDGNDNLYSQQEQPDLSRAYSRNYPIINHILQLPMVKAALKNTPDHLALCFDMTEGKLKLGVRDSIARDGLAVFCTNNDIFESVYTHELLSHPHSGSIIAQAINKLYEKSERHTVDSPREATRRIPDPLITWCRKHAPANDPLVLFKAMYKALAMKVHPDTNTVKIADPKKATQELNEWAATYGIT